MPASILDTLAKVIAQAERASTPAEAEVFMKKAYELSSKYSVDMALARAHTAKSEARETPTSKTIHFGRTVKVSQRKQHVALWIAIVRGYNVKVLIAHNSTYVQVFGMPSDIEVMEALYASLSYQMAKDADAYIRSGSYKAELVRKPVYDYDWDYDRYGREVKRRYQVGFEWGPQDGRVARRAFVTGFVGEIQGRLTTARLDAQAAVAEEVVEVIDQEDGIVTESTGALVLVAREVEVFEYFKANNDARGSYRGLSHAGGSSNRAGAEAGRQADLGGRRAIA